METTPERLAKDHWEWIHGFLKSINELEFEIEMLRYLYETAFVHGYKHGKESKE